MSIYSYFPLFNLLRSFPIAHTNAPIPTLSLSLAHTFTTNRLITAMAENEINLCYCLPIQKMAYTAMHHRPPYVCGNMHPTHRSLYMSWRRRHYDTRSVIFCNFLYFICIFCWPLSTSTDDLLNKDVRRVLHIHTHSHNEKLLSGLRKIPNKLLQSVYRISQSQRDSTRFNSGAMAVQGENVREIHSRFNRVHAIFASIVDFYKSNVLKFIYCVDLVDEKTEFSNRKS